MTVEQDPATRSLWIGTYPPAGADPGSGEGVFRAGVDIGTGALSGGRRVIALPSPSFLAAHPSGRTLYAVGETVPGSLAVLGVSDGTLVARRTVSSGGAEPCHVAATADHVWVANYGDGVATTWPTDDDGMLAAGPETFGNVGSGPVRDRQQGPHAHFAHLVRADGATALVADLGTDELRTHRAAPDGGHASELAATFPPGAGPRHVVELPDGALLVAGELDCRLHLLVPEAGPRKLPRYRHADSFPITGATWGPDGDPGFPSHLTLSPDGRHVHVGVRGPDVLAVLRVEHALAGWKIRHVADVALGAGTWPRHHAVVGPATPPAGDATAPDAATPAADNPAAHAGTPASPEAAATPPARDLIVVAAQNTSELISVLLDRASGTGEVVSRLSFPVPPACVLVP